MAVVVGALASMALAGPSSSPRVRADEPASTVPSDPVFEALLTDASSLRGRIAGLGPDESITLAIDEDRTETIPLTRIVRLTRQDAPGRASAERSLLLFPGGDRLRAILGPSRDDGLQVMPPVLDDATIPVPMDYLLGVLFTRPVDEEVRLRLIDEVREGEREGDDLWLANGDRLSGGLLEVGSESVAMELDTGRVEIPRSAVVALGIDPILTEYPEPAGMYLELSFVDGSRLGVVDARLDKGRVIATTRFGVEIRPTLRNLASIHVRGSSVVYLSDRLESGSEFVGYLGRHPGTYGRDRTWDGHPLRLGGQSYDRGLGTLPRTLLAYVLEPDDLRFQALVGLDDRSGDRAHVVFRVLVDGEERFTSGPLAARDSPVPVDVELEGGRVLILVTEFGESGDVEDVADWVEARLIR